MSRVGSAVSASSRATASEEYAPAARSVADIFANVYRSSKDEQAKRVILVLDAMKATIAEKLSESGTAVDPASAPASAYFATMITALQQRAHEIHGGGDPPRAC